MRQLSAPQEVCMSTKPMDFDKLFTDFNAMASNRSLRILMCICIDSSFSMQGRIRDINRGIRQFLQQLSENQLAVDAAEICLVTFGKQVTVLSDFGKVKQALDAVTVSGGITASGSQTKMGQAVMTALDHLERHRAELKTVGVNFYDPWLILISDGDATDDCGPAVRRVQKMHRDIRLKVKCLSMGEGSEQLKDFTMDGKVDRLEDLQVMDFFAMLSRSISQASQASIQGGDVDLQW